MEKLENKQKLKIADIANQKRHYHLMAKVQKGKVLTKAEIKELKKLEGEENHPYVLETKKDVAKAMGKSVRTIGYWIEDDMPVMEDGRYDLADIKAWQFVKESERKPSGKKSKGGDMNVQELKKLTAEARLKEIQVEEKEGKIIERIVAEEALSELIATAKRQFLSLPKQISPQLIGLDVHEIDDIITDRIKEIIRGFSEGRFI